MRRKASPSPTAEPRSPAGSSLQLAEKHPLAIRWTHWINFPLLFIMIWSGLIIYWAGSIPDVGEEHHIYRIGWGSWTLVRLFPDGFYRLLHLDHHVTRGLAFHALCMWIFVANGVVYLIFLAGSGQWRAIIPDRSSMRQLLADPARRQPERKYNPAQRLAYTAVLLMAAGCVFTGIAIWKPTTLPLATAICGGYQSARWLHFWLTMGICGFIAVHLLQVLRAGWNNLRSMIAGVEVFAVIADAAAAPVESEVATDAGGRADG